MLSLLLKAKGALAGIWGYVAAAGAVLIAIWSMLASAKKSGKDEVKAAAAEKEIEDVKTAQKVERDVAVTKPDAVRKRLRDKYSRD